MADLFPERLEPTTGVSPLERQQAYRDTQQQRRRQQPTPPRPAEPQEEAETGSGEAADETPHQLDRLA
ncbi:MAG TPA: hypothetical protein VMH85_11660 [Terriglobales bacterium]|nr:hypothetical protein [Terriglobales bacterium]